MRRHILTVGLLKKGRDKNLLKGINIVNLLDYFIWFLFPFVFAIIDGDLLNALLISLIVMIVAILFGFNKDKYAAEVLARKLYNEE